jgi:acyl carrier protein
VTGERDVEAAVLAALSIELKVSEAEIRAVRSLKTDLKMDSIAAVNVAFMLEEELGIEIELRDDDAFDSIEAIVNVVSRSM